MPVKNSFLTVLFIALLIGAFLPPLYHRSFFSSANAFFVQNPADLPPAAPTTLPTPSMPLPFYQEGFVGEPRSATSPSLKSVHSPTVVALGNGNLLAVWYGGSREGGRDVLLYQSIWNKKTGLWGTTSALTGPEETQADLQRYIRKIGNPVLARDLSGKIWLFYVTVSVGGWSGGAINYRVSSDDGIHFSPAKRLITTPFFNISTLVRTTPFLYRDGSIGLPIYHEFLGKFGELLRIGPDGTVLDKVRISWGRSSLQPSIVPLDETRGMAFLRYSGHPPRRILTTTTEDGGQTWSDPTKLTLPNPNSSIMGLRLHNGDLLLVFNNSEEHRANLSLARSTDEGKSWKQVHRFERTPQPAEDGSAAHFEFSYPSLIQTQDDTIHLLYTWNRKRIRHVTFNPAFLKDL